MGITELNHINIRTCKMEETKDFFVNIVDLLITSSILSIFDKIFKLLISDLINSKFLSILIVYYQIVIK